MFNGIFCHTAARVINLVEFNRVEMCPCPCYGWYDRTYPAPKKQRIKILIPAKEASTPMCFSCLVPQAFWFQTQETGRGMLKSIKREYMNKNHPRMRVKTDLQISACPSKLKQHQATEDRENLFPKLIQSHDPRELATLCVFDYNCVQGRL